VGRCAPTMASGTLIYAGVNGKTLVTPVPCYANPPNCERNMLGMASDESLTMWIFLVPRFLDSLLPLQDPLRWIFRIEKLRLVRCYLNVFKLA